MSLCPLEDNDLNQLWPHLEDRVRPRADAYGLDRSVLQACMTIAVSLVPLASPLEKGPTGGVVSFQDCGILSKWLNFSEPVFPSVKCGSLQLREASAGSLGALMDTSGLVFHTHCCGRFHPSALQETG